MFRQNEMVLVVNRGIKGLFEPYVLEDFIREDGELPILEKEKCPDLVVEARNLPLEFRSPDTVHDWDGVGDIVLQFESGECRRALWDEGRWVSPTAYADFLGGEDPTSPEEEEEALKYASLGMGTITGWLPAVEAAKQLLLFGDKLEKEMNSFSLYKKGGFAVTVRK